MAMRYVILGESVCFDYRGHNSEKLWFYNQAILMYITKDLSVHTRERGVVGRLSFKKIGYLHPLELPGIDICRYIASGTISLLSIKDYNNCEIDLIGAWL